MKLYYNNEYKCPICNKYILCNSLLVNICIMVDPPKDILQSQCDSCNHNHNINKDGCSCTIDMFIIHINMLRNDLLESNHYASFYFPFIGDQ